MLSHLRVRIIWLAYVAMNTMEAAQMMVLLIDTDLGCDFVFFYQTVLMPTQIVLSFVCQWVSGVLTDVSAPHAHRVLQAICLACVILDPLMFLFGKQSRWLLLVLYVLRSSTLVQLNNSIGKVLKLHFDATNTPEEDQLPKTNEIFVFSDCLGRLVAVLIGFTLPVMFIDYFRADFETVKLIGFGTIFTVDCVAFTTSLFIPKEYIKKEVETIIRLNPEEESEKIALDDPLAPRGCWHYTKTSFTAFFGHKLLWMLTTQIIMGILVMGIMSTVLRFDLATPPGEGIKPTKGNLCNQFLRNLLVQDIMADSIRAGSAIYYQFVMTHMRPWYFFSRIWFLKMGIIGLLSALTYWQYMPATLGGTILGLLSALIYMLLMFSNSTISAIVPPAIYGFTYAMQGSLNTLVMLIPSGIGALKPPRWVVTTIILAQIGLTTTFSGFLVYFNKDPIMRLDKTPEDSNCYTRWILGYPEGEGRKDDFHVIGNDIEEELDLSTD